MRSYGTEIESTEHFLLRCQNYATKRSELLKGTKDTIGFEVYQEIFQIKS